MARKIAAIACRMHCPLSVKHFDEYRLLLPTLSDHPLHNMASPTTTRRMRKSKPSFGGAAPSSTIPFPRNANMTAVEILAFLPNSIDCADVVYRLVSNGGSRKSIHAIINTHRVSQTGWSLNWCGEAMYKTMARAGYDNWTITKHDQWHDQQKDTWDGGKLDVGDLRTTSDEPAGDVSFSRLAEDVKAMPEGDDALDLTRMVQYCLQNAEDGWLYPRDYKELLRSIGGPAQVKKENVDGAVLKRWERKKPPPPPPPLPATVQPLQEVKGTTETRKRSSVARTTSRNTTPGPSLRVKATTTGEKLQMSATQNALKKSARGGSKIRDEPSVPYTRADVCVTVGGSP